MELNHEEIKQSPTTAIKGILSFFFEQALHLIPFNSPNTLYLV
jgi:hypothetical protein